jgi:glycosyltransferase involved in cell wall biosynthesis
VGAAHEREGAAPRGQADVAVVILTYNEENNLSYALRCVSGWARQVFVFDSFSTDRTLDIAREFGCGVLQHRFVDYARQRNAALETLPITTEWVLFLDADEWLTPELKAEIAAVIASRPAQNGFYLNRRFIWMGKWLRRGYYPSWILRLFRHGKGRCEERSLNEHLVVEGEIGRLQHDFVDENHNGITEWISKHNRYASGEAAELLKQETPEHIAVRFWGSQAERKRWIRYRVWNRMPPLLRPVLYFFLRYVVKGGFLDGMPGLTFHFLQALWYPILIDLKFLEMRRNGSAPAPLAHGGPSGSGSPNGSS